MSVRQRETTLVAGLVLYSTLPTGDGLAAKFSYGKWGKKK